jgi:hypothetical protein
MLTCVKMCLSMCVTVRIGGAFDLSVRQGPVQFYNNGTWYNLCDEGFDDVSAR